MTFCENMNDDPPFHSADVVARCVEKAPHYAPTELGLPVRKAYMVQTASARSRYDLKIASIGEIGLVCNRIYAPSIGAVVLKPNQAGFVLPISGLEGCTINGDGVSPSTIHTPGKLDSVDIRGSRRVILGVTLPKEPLVRLIAALRGTGPEDIALTDRVLTVAPRVGHTLRRQLLSILDALCGERARHLRQAAVNEIFGLMADAYLSVHPEWVAARSYGRRPDWIVRLAEERFVAAEGDALSLADLCTATGVGKSRLYQAFHRVCGEPPLSYFRKRQLMRARSARLAAAPARGTVKRVALDAGMSALGRFSVEYRQLFGETPSATLNTSFLGVAATSSSQVMLIPRSTISKPKPSVGQ